MFQAAAGRTLTELGSLGHVQEVNGYPAITLYVCNNVKNCSFTKFIHSVPNFLKPKLSAVSKLWRNGWDTIVLQCKCRNHRHLTQTFSINVADLIVICNQDLQTLKLINHCWKRWKPAITVDNGNNRQLHNIKEKLGKGQWWFHGGWMGFCLGSVCSANNGHKY